LTADMVPAPYGEPPVISFMFISSWQEQWSL
jgi:hypothetical protein